MKIHLDSIRAQSKNQEQNHPRDIFKVLPKDGKKYSYLRDVQAEVLDKWYTRRNERELVIKMNTGSGKTMVSLLALESCRRQCVGPVVYVVPDKFLQKQVETEATQLGISTTTDPDSIAYLNQKAILLINIHKLFNAKSVFGVGDEGSKIDIGTILIDDAHACMDRIEEQFSIVINQGTTKYDLLLDLLNHDLRQQSATKFADIEAHNNNCFIQLPFWTLQNKLREIHTILSKNVEADIDLKWKLSLVSPYLKSCDCVVTDKKIEFSFRVIPTEVIRSYENARKIVVTATLPDDTILRSHLGISEEAIESAITPQSASDLGERLILVPEAINPNISKSDIKSLVVEYSKKYKVVVIVPSKPKSEFWADTDSLVLSAENIERGLTDFHNQANGLAVMINKYDGIDLPDDDCRILVIDELPTDGSEIEKVDSNILSNNVTSKLRKIRKIEQGMGRAIRSNEDYSVVLLLGKTLTSHLYSRRGIEYFTPGTRKQFEISSSVMDQISGGSIADITEAIEMLLSRNQEWITTIKSALIGLTFSNQVPNRIAYAFRDAYSKVWTGHVDQAVSIIEAAVNAETDPQLKGWLKYYLSSIISINNPSDGQVVLKSASTINSRVVKPIDGIDYQKFGHMAGQAEKCREFLGTYSSDINTLHIDLNSVFSDLVFRPDSSNAFENAVMEIGKFIGFGSQRPENDFGKGPDNLWQCGNLFFFVIECKNECTAEKIKKHDTNQINGSIVWFNTTYDSSCKMIPLLIHPRLVFEYSASPNDNIRIMNEENLEKFKSSVRSFILECTHKGQIAGVDEIRKLLVNNSLSAEAIRDKFTVSVT